MDASERKDVMAVTGNSNPKAPVDKIAVFKDGDTSLVATQISLLQCTKYPNTLPKQLKHNCNRPADSLHHYFSVGQSQIVKDHITFRITLFQGQLISIKIYT